MDQIRKDVLMKTIVPQIVFIISSIIMFTIEFRMTPRSENVFNFQNGLLILLLMEIILFISFLINIHKVLNKSEFSKSRFDNLAIAYTCLGSCSIWQLVILFALEILLFYHAEFHPVDYLLVMLTSSFNEVFSTNQALEFLNILESKTFDS